MKSIKFPRIFSSNHTRVWLSTEYMDATKQNIKLLIQTLRGELLGDPYFGTTIKKFMFEPNSPVLRDIIADIIYTQLALFIPQLKVRREDIIIRQDREKGKLYCYFSGVCQIDYTTMGFDLVLFESSTV